MDFGGWLVVVLITVFGLGLAATFIGSLYVFIMALGRRQWRWVVAILLLWPLATVPYAVRERHAQPQLFRMLVPGAVLAALCLALMYSGFGGLAERAHPKPAAQSVVS